MNAQFWQGRNVFVTGASGLLGGWMVRRLREFGANVIALVRDNVPTSMLSQDTRLKGIVTVHGTLTDEPLIRRTLAEYDIQTVMHLAAQTQVGVAIDDPVGTFEANIQGSWILLEAARQLKNVHVLLASSDKAYGDPVELPYTEDMPLKGRYPYDVSKSCVDLIAQTYAHTYRMPVGIVRCANLFGGGDLNFRRIVPGLMKSALQNETFYIRSDGKYVRDYIYVEDGVDAYLHLAEAMAADASLYGEAFNFGLGERITALDLVERVKALPGAADFDVVVQNIASNEIREQYASSEKAARMLRWAPRFTVDSGLAATRDWYHDTLFPQQKVLAAQA